jgi:phosphatidylglycerophosphatase A
MGRFGRRLLEGVISFLWTGFISQRMPGTVGSIAAIFVITIVEPSALLSLAILSFFVGLFACHMYIVRYKYEVDEDPGYIVIDEACGIFTGTYLLTLCWETSWVDDILYLALFRVFDIFKPGPVRWIESTLKKRGWTLSLGIMADDIVAAFMAASSLSILKLLFIAASKIISKSLL